MLKEVSKQFSTKPVPMSEPDRNPLDDSELGHNLAQAVIKSLSIPEAIQVLRTKIMDRVQIPPGRETSLALTKLDECEMWLKAAPRAQDGAST
jgi:hypothetical protein